MAKAIHEVWRLKDACRLVWQSGPGWSIANLSLVFVQGVLPLLALYLMKLIVDAVATGLTIPDEQAASREVVLLVGLAGIVALVVALCRLAAGFVSEVQAQLVSDRMHAILHGKSMKVDLEYYENSQYYNTLHRAQQEAPYRPTRIVNGLMRVGQSSVSLLAIAGLLLSFHWGLAAILLVTALPWIFVRLKYAGRMYHWNRERTPAERQARYLNWMLTADEHAKEIRLFDLGPLFARRFRDLRQQLRRERLNITLHRSIAELAAQTVATLALFGSYAFIAYRTVQGGLTLGDLVMYFQALQRAQGLLQDLLRGMAGLYEDNLFLSNLYEFLDLKPKVVEPVRPKPIPRPMQTGIVFDHVSFQYPMGTKKVFEDVTLTIRPGEHVALVGENGVGKTTLIKLLCRLYDPTCGRITLDNVDLTQFDTAALRREISVVFQDYARYHLTARENIWLGNIDLPPDGERIAAAARSSDAEEIISRLKYGYETILGKWFEDGEELSIGEWQKVALARAFLRDAQILVLDEPTSHLDARAEYTVFKKFHELTAGRTAILISHRLSTVRMVDRIYVLHDGRIVESGTHNELVEHGGTYARLFETQAQYYR